MKAFNVVITVNSMEDPLGAVPSRKLRLSGMLPFVPVKNLSIEMAAPNFEACLWVTHVTWKGSPGENIENGFFAVDAKPDQRYLQNHAMTSERIVGAFEGCGWLARHDFGDELK